MSAVRILTVVFFCISNVNAQVDEKALLHKIDSLSNIRNSIDQLLKGYREQLQLAERDRMLSDQEMSGVKYYKAKLKMEARLKSEPSPFAKALAVIPRGTVVEISVDPNSDFLLGKFNGELGYLNTTYFEKLPDEIGIIQKLAKEERKKQKETEWRTRQRELELKDNRDAEQRRVKREESDRKKRKVLEQEWGNNIATKIMSRQIWIGMTSDMAQESLGRPDDINRTVYSFGTHEQWVYGAKTRKYLYFEDGILTSWQD